MDDRTEDMHSIVRYDTDQVLRGNVFAGAIARGCGDIESPIFDRLAHHHVHWAAE